MKTKTGKRTVNPTDAFRKEQRRKELNRNKKERKRVREEAIGNKDLESLRDKIQEFVELEEQGRLDKTKKAQKRKLEETYEIVLKKYKEENPDDTQFDELPGPRLMSLPGAVGMAGPVRKTLPTPQDSVYYHPIENPLGLPPAGKPQKWKSHFLALVDIKAPVI
eukprot:gene1469-2092_t